jgi:16S rRNA (uracil1498-N3)-methyltransferase
VALERNQSNYLGNVLRLAAGETIRVFNGRDGEWQAAIAGRKRPDSLTSWQTPQACLIRLRLCAKACPPDYMVKADGASRLAGADLHTQVSRVTRADARHRRGRRAVALSLAKAPSRCARPI